MKKIFVLASLLALGMFVGCGPEEKPKGTGKSTVTSSSTTTTSGGSTAADTGKK